MEDIRTVQAWDPQSYARDAAFVPAYGAALLDVLAPQAHERVLDLGCGDGVLTAQLAARCQVVAVDASAEQVAGARERGLDARVMDGARLTFDDEFHAVFSNATLHWLKDAPAVLRGVHRALKPGGRFVAELGGAGNLQSVRDALTAALAARGIDAAALSPWYFPTPEAYRAQLEEAGFAVDFVSHYARPTPLPGSLADWLRLFGQSFTHAVPERERAALVREVEDALRPKLCSAAGGWTVDYWRLRFVARKR